MIVKKFADQDCIGFNSIGQDWTRTEKFHSPHISERQHILPRDFETAAHVTVS